MKALFRLNRTVSWQRLAVTLLSMTMATALLTSFYIDDVIWRDIMLGTAGAFIASETVRHATKPKSPAPEEKEPSALL